MGEFLLFSERLLAEGEAKGEAKGKVEEARKLVSRLLGRRFPSVSTREFLTRLEGACLEDLERWAEQVVVARTPEEVFAEPSP